MRAWRPNASFKDVRVVRRIGEGNFGQVYLGHICRTDGNVSEVVLKRAKPQAEDAAEIAEAEKKLNVYCMKNAPGCCAPFLGSFEVSESDADVQLSPGHWLVWAFEGDRTLADYLRMRGGNEQLSIDLFGIGIEEAGGDKSVVAETMHQLLSSLVKLHGVGLVHRDVKPANMVYSHKDQKFKLIDLGAMADLRTGTNYVPTEAFLDPLYCPPEQYVMPTDSPNLQKSGILAGMAMSPILWARHHPGKFDSYSAGIILIQLAVPSMRNERNLKSFNLNLSRCDHDLFRWRAEYGSRLARKELVLLDAEDGMLLDLAASLLCEKESRISCNEALKSPFFVEKRPPRIAGAQARVQHGDMTESSKVARYLSAATIDTTFREQDKSPMSSNDSLPDSSAREEEKLHHMHKGLLQLLARQDRSSKQPIEDEIDEEASNSSDSSRSKPRVVSDVENLDFSQYVEGTKIALRLGGALTGLAGKVAGDLAEALGKELASILVVEAEKRRNSTSHGSDTAPDRVLTPLSETADGASPPRSSTHPVAEEDLIATESLEDDNVNLYPEMLPDPLQQSRRGEDRAEVFDDPLLAGTTKVNAMDNFVSRLTTAGETVALASDGSDEDEREYVGNTYVSEHVHLDVMDNVRALRQQVEEMEAALALMSSTMNEIRSCGIGLLDEIPPEEDSP